MTAPRAKARKRKVRPRNICFSNIRERRLLVRRRSPTRGNLTTDYRGQSYVYDAETVLRSASGLAAGAATYRYHADGPIANAI